MRDASTYRGARRNAHRGSVWGHPDCYYNGEQPVLKRKSYISKNPSKYMPHDGGKRFTPTIPRVRSAKDTLLAQFPWLRFVKTFGRSGKFR